jgi:hypothetical protein
LANCPVCQSEIEITSQHYGTLFTCPKCSAVFFVDWSGQPEVSGDDVNGELSSEMSNEIVAEEPVYVEPTSEDTPTPEEIASNYDFSEPLAGIENLNQETIESGMMDTADLADIADFGNADLGQVAFNYTLTISGIDSGAIRAQIEDIIKDSKFGWNVIQLMAQINGGVLIIRSVNAVKASMLMQRVKYLPVKISWRQNVLSSSV